MKAREKILTAFSAIILGGAIGLSSCKNETTSTTVTPPVVNVNMPFPVEVSSSDRLNGEGRGGLHEKRQEYGFI